MSDTIYERSSETVVPDDDSPCPIVKLNDNGCVLRLDDTPDELKRRKILKQVPLPGFRTKAKGKGPRHTKPKRKH
jgi:hypothetical protein